MTAPHPIHLPRSPRRQKLPWAYSPHSFSVSRLLQDKEEVPLRPSDLSLVNGTLKPTFLPPPHPSLPSRGLLLPPRVKLLNG